MKTVLPLALAAWAMIFGACGDGKADAARKMAAAADSVRQAAVVDLEVHHLPLLLEMPDGLQAPGMVWKDEVGKLEIRSGDHFAMDITEAPPDMARLKADLDRDLIRRSTILKETPDLLLYRSEFPDDTSLVYFHFYRSINASGRSFIIEDAQVEKPFTLPDVERMAAAIQPKKPA